MSKRSRKGVARNPPAVEIPWDQITEDMKCQFCHQGKTKDILQSGKLYKLISGRTAEFYHYFCCLFSTEGVQAGKDEEGLNGFLLHDLKQELKRGASIKCDFCKRTGATIKCRKKSCKKTYHFSCGALCRSPGEYFFIFLGEMESFCHNHGPKQSKLSHISSDRMCMICFDTCGDTAGPGPGLLVSPCCGRTYHRDCVQKTALQAGKAAVKCPACNDKEIFNREMERCGIYIPHADAQWEMPENSNFYQFDEMLNSHQRCDSLLCQCPNGPEFNRTGGRFEIIKCQTCGSRGVHMECGKIDVKTKLFICSDCKPEEEESDTDSEAEERLMEEKMDNHDRFMKEKMAERDRLMKEELERLQRTKTEQQRKIDEIKSILSDPDPDPPASSSSGSKGTSRVVILSNGLAETPRFATKMPRKAPSSTDPKVPDTDTDSQSNDEDQIPVIGNICGGSEAQKLKDTASEDTYIEIFDDDSDDSDLEVLEPEVIVSKKKKILSEISNQIRKSSEEDFIPID